MDLGPMTLYQTCRYPVPEERIESTLQHLPQGTRLSFLNDSQLFEDMVRRNNTRLQALFNGLKRFPHKVDVWRYAMLLERGGLYMDADAQLGPEMLSTDIWASSDAILVYDNHLDNIYNGFMYMRTPGSPILRRVLERMIHRGTGGGVNTLRMYHYNLVYLREEVEARIGRSCKSLKHAIEHLRLRPNAHEGNGSSNGLNLTLLTRRKSLSIVDDYGRQLILVRNTTGWGGCKVRSAVAAGMERPW